MEGQNVVTNKIARAEYSEEVEKALSLNHHQSLDALARKNEFGRNSRSATIL